MFEAALRRGLMMGDRIRVTWPGTAFEPPGTIPEGFADCRPVGPDGASLSGIPHLVVKRSEPLSGDLVDLEHVVALWDPPTRRWLHLTTPLGGPDWTDDFGPQKQDPDLTATIIELLRSVAAGQVSEQAFLRQSCNWPWFAPPDPSDWTDDPGPEISDWTDDIGAMAPPDFTDDYGAEEE